MEISNKPMTVKEILEDVKNILGNIDIPAAKIESIGIPVARSINGIQICLDAMNRDEEEKAQKEAEKAKEDEQEIQAVPAEGQDNA